ncbi:MAG TPA: orotidine 5'-phosphate decarboxylase / HUMPS family protein [Candidatus Nanoarchaeia archaeon]|nr:orotidine 5'-phosphate decarboxylase / HUMPS family protein [Candidatus Nanoarchaeia archaeon]
MEEYKAKFIDFLMRTGALRVSGDFSLKSKRLSPWFVNIGDFNDGSSTAALGGFYADAILASGLEFDMLYGIPEKGNALAVATAISMDRKGGNIPWFFTRKTPKDYGEATALSPAERIKALVVGRAPKEGQRIVQLDDVFTAGDAKYEARKVLQSMGNFELPLLAIAVDRMEVGLDGKAAIEEYERTTETRVVSVVNAMDVMEYLKSVPEGEALRRMQNYLRAYGTERVRGSLGALEQRVIDRNRSVVPACDVSLEQFEELVRQTAGIEGIGAYKVGFALGLRHGLPKVVETARKHTTKPIIYDHQKAGTDIPDTGKEFASVCKDAGIDTVILFPQAGPETERAWIYHALDHGLNVVVGGRMTHPAYAKSEGGFITDEGALEMYRIAAQAGISNFVVPGNKTDVIKQVREIVEAEGVAKPVFYAPGFVAQGGKIGDAAKVAGDRWHAIVGRGITQAEDMRKAALEHTSQL